MLGKATLSVSERIHLKTLIIAPGWWTCFTVECRFQNVKVKVLVGAFFFCLQKGSQDNQSIRDRILCEMTDFTFIQATP